MFLLSVLLASLQLEWLDSLKGVGVFTGGSGTGPRRVFWGLGFEGGVVPMTGRT